ncbi:hypothetical protein EZV62_001276 [Acer yangbiense]|uniref:Uncharacterized protein n=1 Tax=Acer yangbiense TaxID=1000413 RepID=A0A5C7ITP9_9ROSI|nr:hypothetical protein EZV62_001276 [Acer yangbiense]
MFSSNYSMLRVKPIAAAALQAINQKKDDNGVFFNLKAYFKCAHECFDRTRKQEEISNCVEYCSVPVVNSQQYFESEMAKFQERLNRSLMVCQDKFESAKLQKTGSDAIIVLESCVDQTIDEGIKSLPHLVGRLKSQFSIKD